jgi:succinate dehydrogenase / fumarate reductase, cytochrome b subunit
VNLLCKKGVAIILLFSQEKSDMATKKTAPVNLNLFTIHVPLPALASFGHRVSGILLFLCIPFMLWMFKLSLTSAADYEHLVTVLSLGWIKFLLWVLLSALVYHLTAGLRHMLMDVGMADSLKSGQITAILVLLTSAVLAVLLGVWLW